MVEWFNSEFFPAKGLPAGYKKILSQSRKLLVDWIMDNIDTRDLPKTSYFDKFPPPSNIPKQIERKMGVLRLTKEEEKEYMLRRDFSNIYEGESPLGIKRGNDKISLQPHQRRFLQGYLLGNLKSAIMFHGVGTGKTFTAVGTAKTYLQIYPKNKVVFVSPPAVLFNFVESCVAYGVNPQDPRISFYSFTKFSNSKTIDTRNTMVLIDEAHNLRTGLQADVSIVGGKLLDKKYQVKKGMRVVKTLINTLDAHKTILLTATPFINKPYDIENLLAIGDHRLPLTEEDFGKIVSNEDNRYDYFKYRISKFDRTSGNEDYPEMREVYVPIDVGTSITAPDFKASVSNVNEAGVKNNFFSGSRQTGLKDTEKKFNFVFDTINENPTKKYVIYTSFLSAGVNKLQSRLQEENIMYGTISGKVNLGMKADAITAYNNFSNEDYGGLKVQVLIITKAGSEGVSLNETRGIFVMDGVWNEASYEQIVARAIRYKSHQFLPKKERFVDVYKLFTCYENEVPILEGISNGEPFDFDEFLKAFNKNKKKLKEAEKVQNELRDNNVNFDRMNNATKLIASTNKNFDEVKFDSLKKGSKERKEYLQENLQFGKDKAKYEINELIGNLSKGFPSTDFYMFVLQKVKFNKTEKLVEEIKKIPMVENAVEDLPNGKELFRRITEIAENKKKSKDKDIIEFLINSLNKKEKEVGAEITRNIKTKLGGIDELIAKKQELAELSKAKQKARINQEFFTPTYLVERMIEMSSLGDQQKKTEGEILEPTAGWGNIVKGILNTLTKKKLNYRVDMVEYLEENRKELQKISDIVPSVINLMRENNFMTFTPSKRYNYIFINPPFHLQKRFNKQLTSDIYDYDFVERAYAFLGMKGELICLTGLKFQESERAKKFYKSVNAKITILKNVNWTGAEVKAGGEVKALNIALIKIKRNSIDYDEENNIIEKGYKFFSN